jgi:uncharacterized GH25 family protein
VSLAALQHRAPHDTLAIPARLCFFSLMKKLLLASAFLAVFAGSASAYTAYLMPDEFLPDDRVVLLHASYATTFFTPMRAVGANIAAIEPDGGEGFFSQMEVTSDSTRMAATLYEQGTYRFTTGEQLGRVANMVGVEGNWRELGATETPPEGAEVRTMQTVTVADVFVTLGAPTRTTVDRAIGRLALRPVTHPNQIVAGQGFQVNVTFDGAPFANAALVVYKAGEPENDLDRYATTDAAGNAMVALDGPGQYILVVRHRADAPAGAQAQVQSFTTSLVFEAHETLPPVVQLPSAPEDNRPRRRRR